MIYIDDCQNEEERKAKQKKFEELKQKNLMLWHQEKNIIKTMIMILVKIIKIMIRNLK